MRVEGQGKAVDIFPAKAQAAKPVAERTEIKEKIGLEALAVPREESHEAKEIEEAARILNQAMKLSNVHLEFQPYEDSGRYQVKVVDSLTNNVIKEIPPDYMLEFSTRMREVIDKVVGLFVDELV